MSSEERPKSALHGKTGHVVCHGAIPQPTMGMAGHAAIFVVRTADQWVICLRHGLGEYDWDAADTNLGAEIPGEQFAPFAQRGLPAVGDGAVPFETLREIMDMSFVNGEWHWFEPEAGAEEA